MNGRAKERHWVTVRLCSDTMWSVFAAAHVLFQHSGKWTAAVLQDLQVYEIIWLGCFLLESVGSCRWPQSMAQRLRGQRGFDTYNECTLRALTGGRWPEGSNRRSWGGRGQKRWRKFYFR